MMLQLSDRQPHTVISCGEGHHHVIGLATLRRWVAAQLPYDNIEPCLVRSIVADWLLHSDVSPDDDAWVRLGDLPPGLLFATQTGALAVKTEYHHIGGQCRCVLLGRGEYASFAEGNDTLVMALEIAQPQPGQEGSSDE